MKSVRSSGIGGGIHRIWFGSTFSAPKSFRIPSWASGTSSPCSTDGRMR